MPAEHLVVLDAFTYAGHVESLAGVERVEIVRGDICDLALVERTLREHDVDVIVHLAAETHVDRSIVDPLVFARTNVVGTTTVLEAARRTGVRRVLHVSSDEVYGELGVDAQPRDEAAPLAPSSPYAASKAGAEYAVRAFARTYGLDVVIARPSNTYGPYQLPEKLIPVMIECALAGRGLPVYGDGLQRREWLHVDDHCAALDRLIDAGSAGGVYNVSAGDERTNLEIVRAILARLGLPDSRIDRVRDRPGHDRRYAITAARLRALGWAPEHALDGGLAATVDWYGANGAWVAAVRTPSSERFLAANYAERGRP